MEKKNFKKKVTGVIHDVGICALAGLGIAGAVSLVLAFISAIVSGFQWYVVLNAMRSGLLIVGSLLLFITAGVIIGQKGNQKIRSHKKWKDTFYELGPTFVFLFIGVTVILAATAVDYIVWLS